MAQQKDLPLSGLKVVELGTVAAVPRSARVFGAFGADVIKIEALNGDDYRGLKQFPNQYDTLFTLENSNKRYVSINLKDPAGREALLKILENADVFMTNVRNRGLQRLGLDYDSIKERFPRLIYAHFSGYGETGPEKDRPGYDTSAFWAKSGAMVDMVREGADPLRPPIGFGDLATTNAIIAGILMALYARQVYGHGTFVSASLYGSAIWCASNAVITSQEVIGARYPDDFDRPRNPLGRNYRCKDGEWINFNFSRYDQFWPQSCKLFGLEEYLDDPRYSTTEGLRQGDHKYELTQMIAKAVAQKTQAEWLEELAKVDNVYQKVNHFRDVAADPQAWANEFLEEVDFGDRPGKVVMPRPPMQFSEFGILPYVPTAPIGAHTREVLEAAGYSPQEVDELAQAGVVVTGEAQDKFVPDGHEIIL